MELRHLRYFVAVAESGGFSRAARRLYVSQSALSEQIADLEAELGVQLFDRSRLRAALTAPGELFLKEARKVLGSADQAMKVARDSASGDLGEIRIGFFTGGVGPNFSRLIQRFRQAHPRVRISLHEMIPALQWKALAEGRIDIAFTRRLGVSNDAHLRVEVLRKDPLYAVLPRNHPLAPGPVDVRALANERFVLCVRETSPALFDKVIEMCSEAGFSPEIANTANVWSSIVMLVQAGEGISILPTNTLQELPKSGLAFCPLKQKNAWVELVMAWSPERESTVLHHLQQIIREAGGRV
ncbi:LysR family transcriptional regulator [Terriglobus tenax]|uniref:LysR family transcriptional regulator n=1 Tax=Terriglobus tenax TaxID=1111115 RepID=UPI0021E062B9|nr:LysR substrate-binding domain-containing protein [Terriglobus tenax]